jgi:DNA repair protein RadC
MRAPVSCLPCIHGEPYGARVAHDPGAYGGARVAHDPGAYGEVQRRADVVGAIGSPAAFYWVISPLVAGEHQEVAHVTLLDLYGRFRRVREIGRGTHDQVEVPIPFALRAALDASCRYLILSHNHPTGLAWPSEADAELTEAVESAAYEVDLVLLDHVVLGRGQFFSFREGQLWTIRS